MKKYIIITIVCLLVGLIYTETILTPKKDLEYSQEYIVGAEHIKGDVDVEYWASLGEEFEIGANREGYAVFKNPRKAMKTLRSQYREGIVRIREENPFLGPFVFSYKNYSLYCESIPLDDPDRGQVNVVLRFIDIYDNSF